MARRINRGRSKIYDFVDIPPPAPDNSLFFVRRDRRALLLVGEEPHNGSETHTSAEQYSSQRQIHLFISANPGKRSTAVRVNNLAEALKENIHPRSRKSTRSRKRKRTSVASWGIIIHEISLPYLIAEPRFMETKPFCLRIPKQV